MASPKKVLVVYSLGARCYPCEDAERAAEEFAKDRGLELIKENALNPKFEIGPRFLTAPVTCSAHRAGDKLELDRCVFGYSPDQKRKLESLFEE